MGWQDVEINDHDRLDWLERNTQRLKDVYWRLENQEETLREAVDWLMRNQEGE